MNDKEKKEEVLDIAEMSSFFLGLVIAALLSLDLVYGLSIGFNSLAFRFRYDHPLMAYLAVWFTIIGIELSIIIGLDWVFCDIARHMGKEMEDRRSLIGHWVRTFMMVTLLTLLSSLPISFVFLESAFFKGIGQIARYMNIAIIILMIFFMFMVLVDLANRD